MVPKLSRSKGSLVPTRCKMLCIVIMDCSVDSARQAWSSPLSKCSERAKNSMRRRSAMDWRGICAAARAIRELSRAFWKSQHRTARPRHMRLEGIEIMTTLTKAVKDVTDMDYIGRSVLRREDDRLLSGNGRFTED